MTLKNGLLILGILVGVNSWLSFSSAAPTALDLSSTKVQTLESAPVTLKEKFTGDLLLLDFWASWCSPCKESLPFYQELQKKFSPQGLQVLAISVDDEAKDATRFIKKNKLSLNFLWDPQGALARSLGIQSLPATLLLDKSGKILFQEKGFSEASKTKLENQLQTLAKNKPAPSDGPEKKRP